MAIVFGRIAIVVEEVVTGHELALQIRMRRINPAIHNRDHDVTGARRDIPYRRRTDLGHSPFSRELRIVGRLRTARLVVGLHALEVARCQQPGLCSIRLLTRDFNDRCAKRVDAADFLCADLTESLLTKPWLEPRAYPHHESTGTPGSHGMKRSLRARWVLRCHGPQR